MPNVVFPTAIEAIDGRHFVFYGMADSRIGVARLEGTDQWSITSRRLTVLLLALVDGAWA